MGTFKFSARLVYFLCLVLILNLTGLVFNVKAATLVKGDTDSQTCDKGSTMAAVNNYIPELLSPGSSTTHKDFEDLMEGNWKCSHVCVPNNQNAADYVKTLTFKDGITPIYFSKLSDVEKYKNAKDSKSLTHAINISNIKSTCAGPNSVNYEPISTTRLTRSDTSSAAKTAAGDEKQMPAPVEKEDGANPADPKSSGTSNSDAVKEDGDITLKIKGTATISDFSQFPLLIVVGFSPIDETANPEDCSKYFYVNKGEPFEHDIIVKKAYYEKFVNESKLHYYTENRDEKDNLYNFSLNTKAFPAKAIDGVVELDLGTFNQSLILNDKADTVWVDFAETTGVPKQQYDKCVEQAAGIFREQIKDDTNLGTSQDEQVQKQTQEKSRVAKNKQIAGTVGAGVGALGGGLLGLKIGAGIGAFGGPVGIAAGAIIGGAVGALGGWLAGGLF